MGGASLGIYTCCQSTPAGENLCNKSINRERNLKIPRTSKNLLTNSGRPFENHPGLGKPVRSNAGRLMA
jgi:hypothetical protein